MINLLKQEGIHEAQMGVKLRMHQKLQTSQKVHTFIILEVLHRHLVEAECIRMQKSRIFDRWLTVNILEYYSTCTH